MQNATMRETDTRESVQVFGPSRWWSAAARERFIAAMQPALGLRHPNLVRVLAVRERGDTVVILTEDVTGVTLESILAAEPLQSINAIASILTQVGMALEHAHAAGVAHGAISSSCIIVDENGDAMVADIGRAAAVAAAGVHGDFGDSAPPAYASPELHRGAHPSPASDQYALGALAYELLADRGPLDTSPGWLRRIQLRWHPDATDFSSRDVPEEWSRAVKRMLEARPANRFPSITDAVRVFAHASDGQDQRFRGPLGWIVKQQLSGAMPLEEDTQDAAAAGSPFASINAPIVDLMEERLRDAVRRQAPRILSRAAGLRRRALAVGACAVLVGAVVWWRTPSSTVDRLHGDVALEMSQLESPRTSDAPITVAPPANTPPDPVSAARQPVESLPPAPAEPAAREPAAREPAAREAVVRHALVIPPPRAEQRAMASRTRQHPKVIVPPDPSPGQSAATHTLNVEARPRPVIASNPSSPPPQPVGAAVTRVGEPPAATPASAPASSPSTPGSSPSTPALSPSAPASSPSTPVSTASTLSAAPPPPAPRASPAPLSAADATTAARIVVDQLRTSNVRALSASMISSPVDQAFIDWLARRPVDLEMGTPTAPRVTLTPDGGAQVRYVVPVTWTHASGARPSRTATVVVAVRAAAGGAAVVSWSLAQPFAP
ncbi:MAG: serine/threonine protein kinase [Gemmatimonadaceae bacterium]